MQNNNVTDWEISAISHIIYNHVSASSVLMRTSSSPGTEWGCESPCSLSDSELASTAAHDFSLPSSELSDTGIFNCEERQGN